MSTTSYYTSNSYPALCCSSRTAPASEAKGGIPGYGPDYGPGPWPGYGPGRLPVAALIEAGS